MKSNRELRPISPTQKRKARVAEQPFLAHFVTNVEDQWLRIKNARVLQTGRTDSDMRSMRGTAKWPHDCWPRTQAWGATDK